MDTIARLRIKNKCFEILVDCDKALDFKKGKLDSKSLREILSAEVVFTDHKKGMRASMADLEKAFNTTNIYEIAEKILKQGELQLPQQYREKEREKKLKQIIDFLVRNCIDPRTGIPYTPTMLESVIKEAGVKIEETKETVEQALEIIKKIETKLPIKIATKKLKIIVPAQYTAIVYSFLQKFKKEKEEWLENGSFLCIIDLPAGMQVEFFDKLNNLTKGLAITEEIK
ncbi:MAG: ribosome assembly factor SBDS [Candidatus Pacearchaeota archaeon]|nr:ribosome assembly factor SBDS [Candidatus Pacearchaeota archaeon]